MVLTNTGRTTLRGSINSDLSSGQTGTGTFPPNIDQAGLFEPIAATLNALSTQVVSANTITVTHIVTTSEGNSSQLAEWEILGNSDTTNYNRLVRAPILKNSVTQITIIHVFNLIRV
jgi:hypothetical protein